MVRDQGFWPGEPAKGMDELICEMCGKKYMSHCDPKVVTEDNLIAVLFYCCSLECERKSWERADGKGNRKD